MHRASRAAPIFLVLLALRLDAQFSEARVYSDDRLLKEHDRQIASGLDEQIRRFFITTGWDEEFADLGLVIEIQLLFEGVAEKGADRVFSAQALFSNGTDQRFFTRSLQFPYSAGQGLTYSPAIFEPLASTLEFYAYLLLAGEADSWGVFSGTKFFERAREVAIRGASSLYPRGWEDRIELVDQLANNRGLRAARLHFFTGVDLEWSGQFADAAAAYVQMVNGIQAAFVRYPRDRYTLIFLEAHAPALATISAELPGREALLDSLAAYDPDRADIYRPRPKESSE